MKKNILYLIFFVELLLISSSSVFAASDLVCIYGPHESTSMWNTEFSESAVMIIQKNNELSAKKHTGEGDWKDPGSDGWEDFGLSASTPFDVTDTSKASGKLLTGCPAYIQTEFVLASSSRIEFHDSNDEKYHSIYSSPSVSELPPEPETGVSSSNKQWLSECYYVGTDVSIKFNQDEMDVKYPSSITDSNGNYYEVKGYKIDLEDLKTAYAIKESGCPTLHYDSKDHKLFINTKLYNGSMTFALNQKASVTMKGKLDSSGNIVTETGNPEVPDIDKCSTLLGSPTNNQDPAYYIVVAFKVVKYVAIILLIVLSVMDVVGAVASNDNDALNKMMSKIVKRFILCIAIFLLPTLIQFILQFIYNATPDLCGLM